MQYHCDGWNDGLHCAQWDLPQCERCRVYQAGAQSAREIAPHYQVPATIHDSVYALYYREDMLTHVLAWMESELV